MMNTIGNDWWWGRQGLVSQFGVQVYFPSLSPYFQTVRRQSPPSANTISFPPQVQILNRQIWDWCHLRLYQVMMIMIIMMIMAMVVTSMLIMEIKMIMMMTMMRKTRGNVWLISFCLQIIINHQNTIGCVGSKSAISSFPGSCFEASTPLFFARLFWLWEDGDRMIRLLSTVRVRLFCVFVSVLLFCE